MAVVAFLFANIATIDSGVGYGYLAVAMGCAFAIVGLQRSPLRTIALRRSSLFLTAFLAYFLLRLLLDYSDSDLIRAHSIGTDGGVVFGLLFGLMTSFLVAATFANARQRWAVPITVLFLAISLALAWNVYTNHLQFIRADVFLISGDRGNYQRPGNFTIMIVVIASVQLAQAARIQRGVEVRRLGLLAGVFIYLMLVGVLLISSQLIGSNTGFVVTAFLAVATLAWIARPSLARMKGRLLFSSRALSPVAALRRALPRFAFNGAVLLALMAICGTAMLAYLSIDIQQLRIFGFSERSFLYSLLGRLDILQRNFVAQFAYSPLFGNIDVDSRTTGQGSYAHSLVSILSHLGIVGASLFAAYIVAVYKESRRLPANAALFYGDLDLGMLRLILVIMILGYCLVGTFFTWLPLWFCLGLLYPPMRLRMTLKRPRQYRRAPSMALQ